MKKSLSLILLLPLLVIAQDIEYSWWVHFEHEPTSEKMFGKNLKDEYSDFTSIALFSCESNAIFSSEQCEEIDRNNAKFNVTGDFNSDGKVEIWNVGVAKTQSGSYANIIVVRDKASKQISQILTLEREWPGFAIFSHTKDSIRLFFCMECGDYANLVWLKDKWVFSWPEPYG